eukprot:gene186-320_t
MSEENNPEVILNKYKNMTAECQNLTAKISELNMSREEHKLVVETLSTLNDDRKAFRLVGGVLVERTVGEILPIVSQNYEGIKQLIETLDDNLKKKDLETKNYKSQYGIMTQAEREAKMRGIAS